MINENNILGGSLRVKGSLIVKTISYEHNLFYMAYVNKITLPNVFTSSGFSGNMIVTDMTDSYSKELGMCTTFEFEAVI